MCLKQIFLKHHLIYFEPLYDYIFTLTFGGCNVHHNLFPGPLPMILSLLLIFLPS